MEKLGVLLKIGNTDTRFRYVCQAHRYGKRLSRASLPRNFDQRVFNIRSARFGYGGGYQGMEIAAAVLQIEPAFGKIADTAVRQRGAVIEQRCLVIGLRSWMLSAVLFVHCQFRRPSHWHVQI